MRVHTHARTDTTHECWLCVHKQVAAGGRRGRKYFFDPYTHFRPADADEQGGGGGDDDDIVHR